MGVAKSEKRAKEILRYLKHGKIDHVVLFHCSHVIEEAEGDDDNLPLFVSERIDKWLKNNPLGKEKDDAKIARGQKNSS